MGGSGIDSNIGSLNSAAAAAGGSDNSWGSNSNTNSWRADSFVGARDFVLEASPRGANVGCISHGELRKRVLLMHNIWKWRFLMV